MNAIALPPEQFIFAQDYELKTNSLKVAEAFEKNHKDVLRAIDRIVVQVSDSFNRRNFAPVDYTDAKGEKRPMYELSKDGFIMVVMSFTGEKAMAIKESYINAFNFMAEKLFPKRYGLIDLPEPPTITKAQAGELFNRVTVIASGSGKIRAELWSRFQNHFKLSSYKDLPADQYDEAIAYLDAKRDEYLGAGVEMLYLSSQELEARIAERVKAIEGELIGKSEQAIGPADTVIRIGMDGGIKYMMLSLHGTADAPARFLVDVSRSSVYINSVQHEALALTEREFIDFLVKERGYIVVKKAEVVSKLAS